MAATGKRSRISLGCRPSQLLDASASLAPWTPRCPRLTAASLRDYPDRDQASLRQAIAAIHGLSPDWVLPGNGAAELFTWAARDAAAAGVSGLLAPVLPITGGPCSVGMRPGWRRHWRSLGSTLARCTTLRLRVAVVWICKSPQPHRAALEPCLARSDARSPCAGDLR